MERWPRWPRWGSPGRLSSSAKVVIDGGGGGDSNSGTTSLEVPITGTENQLAVVDLHYAGGSGATITVPAGWNTEYEAHDANTGWSGTYWRLLTGSEPASYTWTFSASAAASYAVNYYECVNTNQPISAVGKSNNGNGTTATGKSVTPPNKKNRKVLVVQTDTTATTTPPGGFTEQADTNTTGTSLATAGATADTATATGDISATLSTSTDWMARLYTIAPCGSSGTPAPPINLAVSAYDHESITLVWDDIATDETGFKIERSPNGVSWALIHTTVADVETWQDTGLTAETTYYYRLYAYNGNGNSAYSGTVSQLTDAAATVELPLYRAQSTATSGFANSLVIAKPTGTVDGDLMLLQVSLATLQTINTPAGWTPVATVDQGEVSSDNRLAVFSRVASSEPASYTVTLGTFSNITLGIITWYSNTSQALVVDASATQVNTPATTNHVAPSVTTTIAKTALNCFYTLSNSNAGTEHAGMTERWDYPSGASESYLMTGDVESAGATGARTMTGGSLISASISVAIGESV